MRKDYYNRLMFYYFGNNKDIHELCTKFMSLTYKEGYKSEGEDLRHFMMGFAPKEVYKDSAYYTLIDTLKSCGLHDYENVLCDLYSAFYNEITNQE